MTIDNYTLVCLDDGNYADVELKHTAFVDLLKTHNKGRLVDLLILDVEGAEYGILPLLIGNRAFSVSSSSPNKAFC